MNYLDLEISEYKFVVKTWKRGLVDIFSALALPDAQILRSGPVDGKRTLTDTRLLLGFLDKEGAVIVETELDRTTRVVPGGPAWRAEFISREAVDKSITHLNLQQILGREFFRQIAIPRLLQLLAPGPMTPPDSGVLPLWRKLMGPQPNKCSGDRLTDNHLHRYMIYQLAKVALERARSLIRSKHMKVRSKVEGEEDEDEGEEDEEEPLNIKFKDVDMVRDETPIDPEQIAADQQRLITQSSIVQNPYQQFPVEERQLDNYQHHVSASPRPRCPPDWWPECGNYTTVAPGCRSLPDLTTCESLDSAPPLYYRLSYREPQPGRVHHEAFLGTIP